MKSHNKLNQKKIFKQTNIWAKSLRYCRIPAAAAAAAAKLLQSCPTLCNPIDGRPPGSPVPGILQARTLEWVAISFSNTWRWKVKVKSLSRVRLFTTSWTVAYKAPPSMGFSRQEYWSGVLSPSPQNTWYRDKLLNVSSQKTKTTNRSSHTSEWELHGNGLLKGNTGS